MTSLARHRSAEAAPFRGTGRNQSTGREGSPPEATPRRARETLKTCAFDSAGIKKYALQVQRAYNGNPCLRLVEGVPREDGTFRRFEITVWSEDFESLFEAIDEVRQFIRANGIRTPKGHKWTPKPPMRSNDAAVPTSRAATKPPARPGPPPPPPPPPPSPSRSASAPRSRSETNDPWASIPAGSRRPVNGSSRAR